MLFEPYIFKPSRAIRFALLLGFTASWRAWGADQPPAPGSTEQVETLSSSHSAVYGLIDRLSERGVITKQETNELRLLAEADEAEMRAQIAATQAATAEAAAVRARLRAVLAQTAGRRSTPLAGAAPAPQSAPYPQTASAEAPAPAWRPPPAAPVARVPAMSPSEAAQTSPPEEPDANGSAMAARASFPAARTRVVLPPADYSDVARTDTARESYRAPAAAPAADDSNVAPAGTSSRAVASTEEAPIPQWAVAAENIRASRAASANRPSIDAPAQTAAPEPQLAPNTVRVSYVPDVVKEQIRDEVRNDILNDAAKEGWATPGAVPDWITRFRLMGDLRFRYENLVYPPGNLPTNPNNVGSGYWSFNAINTGSPYDINSATNPNNPPFPNVDQDRNRLRIRARMGTIVEFSDSCAVGLRLATGESNSPVTENQSLGAAGSGSGGNFSKYAVWLDRAYLKYETGGLPNQDLTVNLGRFDNPFFATNMIWADDLGFDGLAVQGKFPASDNITPFFTVGAFPVFNTDLNYASNQPAKYKSQDKWLLAAQLGTAIDLGPNFGLKLGAAYYLFKNIEGKVSDPMVPIAATDAGNTDASRPAFAQKGNSYIALRNIVPTYDANNKLLPQYQYFGLATPFHELAFTTELSYNQFEPFQVALVGEYVKNLAFNRDTILKNGPPQLLGPVNNNATDGTTFGGGNAAWMAVLRVGRLNPKQRWDWNVNLGYRSVQSDAVVDGFCDSDFGGGGTNMKGYTVSANLALFTDVWLGLRYMSATQIAGPAFKNDIIQIDVNSRF
jgi:hypothetical protein